MPWLDPEKKKGQEKRWAQTDRGREFIAARQKRRRERLRRELLAAYGAVCACCGETIPEFLTVEHKGGVIPDSHRWPNGKRKVGTTLIDQLKTEGWPDSCELLCWNCNEGRANHGGVCPHEKYRLKALAS